MRETERLAADSLRAGQARQLTRLLRWTATHSRFYQSRGWIPDVFRGLAKRHDAFWDVWHRIPILSKPELRAQGGLIHITKIPADQRPIGRQISSGSTGIAVEVKTTAITRAMWKALTVREHLWQKRDFSKRLGAIRYRRVSDRSPAGGDHPSWGPPVANLFTTGPASFVHIGHGIDMLADWLVRFDPHYLLTHPSIAEHLLERARDASTQPLQLEEICFIGEPVDPDLERRLVDRYGLRVTEIYSANETGVIAFRCELGALHVQSEALLVEILDDQWQPCRLGEPGRVVVTVLHNLATPLIRYDLGDYAIAHRDCACGRGLPVLGQVMGRVRNLVRTPDGRRSWPVDLARIRKVSAIRQAQYVQSAVDTVQLHIVSDRPLTDVEEDQATTAVQTALGYPFKVEVVRVTEIPRGPTGKFEEFISRLDETSAAPRT